jgi:energy-coupling factor transport system ATP-binding protein
LIGETVEEDLLLTLELAGVPFKEREQRLQRVLESVGMQHLRYYPITELSGGQKQLLAVAGCIAAEAGLIIFDEATSMLDPLAREKLLQAARAIHRQGVTIVWVTHAMEELTGADRVVVLERGRLAYEGDVLRFFYEAESIHELGATACERFGFEPPFAVQAGRELIARGVEFIERPLSWEALQRELEVKLQ